MATEPENARLYFKFRPTTLRLASDPDLTTHRAYRVPKPEPTPALMEAMDTVRINPDRRVPRAAAARGRPLLQELDGYAYTPADQGDVERQWPQLKGLFLIDRGGIVRWPTSSARPRAWPASASSLPRTDPRRGARLANTH